MEYNSFYDFLVDRGYFFDKDIIEDFLLTIKVNPFVILLGPSGVGKSVLPKLFSEYLSNQFKKEEIIIHAVNSLGKSHSNKEWHLKRDTMKEILPILPFEGKYCPFTINDSFSSMGKFKLDPRFRFNDKKLIEHLIKLQTEDPSQNLDLKIKVGEKIIKHEFDVIYNLKNEFILFKNKINNQNCGIESIIYNFFNIHGNDEEKNKIRFLVFENITNLDEDYILELLSFSQKFSFKDSTNIMVGNINNEDFFQDFSSVFLDVVSIIELNQLSLEKYLSTDFQSKNYFKDLNYLEYQIIDDEIINLNIYGIKRIFTNVSYDGQSFWEILSNELLLFNNCFNKYEINISFRCVLDILKFMVCAWKYEGKQENWENWKKYLDFQIMQKLLPKIKKSITGLDNLLNELLVICNKNTEEHHVKYRKSYFKLKNMICYHQKGEDVSFFKCSNNFFVNQREYKTESTFQHVDDVELEDSDYFVEDKWDNVGLVWDDEYFVNYDDGELFDLESISENISSLKGWQKLVFEAINTINEDIFSIHDLKGLEIFQIYQFEDDSLEQIIVENLNKLSKRSIIIKVGDNTYKKVFNDDI